MSRSNPWTSEDGGPRRLQAWPGAFAGFDPATAQVRSRDAVGATMIAVHPTGGVYLHGHTMGPEGTAWVERIDPETLEAVARIDDLPGGPTWPGGLGVHDDGSLHVVFGCHAHRLSIDLEVEATARLPRERPYNSFVTMPDGHLVTKDFGGRRPEEPESSVAPPCQLVVLEPVSLDVVARADLPEPSVARLSADGDTVVVVGDTALWRAHWNGTELTLDDGFRARYQTLAGQTHGWDAVLALGAAWFLDNGAGSQNYAGTLRGRGSSTAPLHLVRVALDTGEVTLTEVCGRPGGLVANPPLIDPVRRIALAYDTGNGAMTAFSIADDGTLTRRWQVDQDHGSHLLADPDNGLVLTLDHDGERWMEQIVIRDLDTGDERLRVDSGSPLQSVLFPATGRDRQVFVCTFSTLSSLTW